MGRSEVVPGGGFLVAVGYKTNHFGRSQHVLLIRSSWGRLRGDNGNNLLPIAFLRSQLAKDFWTLVSEQGLDLGEFSQPSVIDLIEKTSGKY